MKNIIVAALVAAIVVLGFVKMLDHQSGAAPAASHPSAYERVISTRVVRCSYAAFPPFLNIDPNNHLSGIFYDVLEEAAKRLNLKIDWTEEVTYGTINTGFETGRYDAFCGGLWPAGSRAPNTAFSRAIVWEPMGVWVRGDDSRFDDNIGKLNDPAYKITDIDGDATTSMIDALFPKAGRVFAIQGQNISDEIQQVMTNKADAMIADYISTQRWLEKSPGGVKNLASEKPIFVIGVTIGFNQNEFALRDMFDVVLDDMDRDGTIARVVKTYLGDKSNMLFYKKSEFMPY